MVKKLKLLDRVDDQQLADAVRNSAQQIWQAGLGAFAKAQEEGGKVFAKLVKNGTHLQKRSRHLAQDKIARINEPGTSMVDPAGKHDGGSWDKLEQVFEDRVARSLSSLGVPSQEEFHALQQRVAQLSQEIDALSSQKVAATIAPRAARQLNSTNKKSAPKGINKTTLKAIAKKPVIATTAKRGAVRPKG